TAATTQERSRLRAGRATCAPSQASAAPAAPAATSGAAGAVIGRHSVADLAGGGWGSHAGATAAARSAPHADAHVPPAGRGGREKSCARSQTASSQTPRAVAAAVGNSPVTVGRGSGGLLVPRDPQSNFAPGIVGSWEAVRVTDHETESGAPPTARRRPTA